MTRAAVLRALNQSLSIEEIEVDEPGAGEVKVRLSASGLCHSDYGLMQGTFPLPLPAVPGHEGSGVVLEVGEGVTRVVPGDSVILCPTPQCGTCFWCSRGQAASCNARLLLPTIGGQLDGTTRLHWEGQDLAQFCFAGTFSEVTVAPEICVVKIPSGINMVVAALIGCGVTTGVGAARNTADIEQGDTVAVIGCGGVGLNVVQGARLAGAERIIAIDVVELKLDLARRMGATDVVSAGSVDPVEAVLALTDGRGADVAFEVTGMAHAATQAFNLTRRGGQMVFVGVGTPDSVIPTRLLLSDAKIAKGCYYGGAVAQDDFLKLVQEYEAGLINLDLLVSKEITLEEVNEGFADMHRGSVARSVIVYDT